jgi:transcriptional regulator with XRE-family HTH domain
MSSAEDLGQRVKAFREMRGMSLRTLGARAQVSPSLLSQLENGRANASIGSLRRISEALGASLTDLFDDKHTVASHLLRKADRPELTMQEGTRKYAITRAPLHHLEVYAAEFDPGGSTGEDAYVHGDSQEILLVLRGMVTASLDQDVYELNAGDSIEYRSSVPHRVTNTGNAMAEVLWITSPPTPEESIPTPTPESGV